MKGSRRGVPGDAAARLLEALSEIDCAALPHIPSRTVTELNTLACPACCGGLKIGLWDRAWIKIRNKVKATSLRVPVPK